MLLPTAKKICIIKSAQTLFMETRGNCAFFFQIFLTMLSWHWNSHSSSTSGCCYCCFFFFTNACCVYFFIHLTLFFFEALHKESTTSSRNSYTKKNHTQECSTVQTNIPKKNRLLYIQETIFCCWKSLKVIFFGSFKPFPYFNQEITWTSMKC